MKSFLFSVVAVILILAGGIISADPVTVDQLVGELLKNNPQLQAAENRSLAAQARPAQMQALPEPVLSFVTRNSNGNPLPFTELGKDPLSSVGFMWEEELPFPGKLRLAGEIAQKEADATKSEIETLKWQLISNLKQSFYDYFRSHKSAQILNSSLELLRRFEEIARSRYSVGEGIQQDVLRAQVEISILQQRITSIEREKATAAAQINRLLNRSIDASLPDPAEITASNCSVNSIDALQSPRSHSSQAMVLREQFGLDLAKKQYRPDFVGSVEYANSPNFPDMWEFHIGLRIPVFYKSKQQNGVREASENLRRAQNEFRSVQQDIAFNIKNESLQIEASEKLLKLYDQAILPQSNLALEASLASYQVGKSDFLTTLNNFITLLEYRINYFDELAKHEAAIARLEGELGRPLPSAPGDNKHE